MREEEREDEDADDEDEKRTKKRSTRTKQERNSRYSCQEDHHQDTDDEDVGDEADERRRAPRSRICRPKVSEHRLTTGAVEKDNAENWKTLDNVCGHDTAFGRHLRHASQPRVQGVDERVSQLSDGARRGTSDDHNFSNVIAVSAPSAVKALCDHGTTRRGGQGQAEGRV